MPQFLIHWTIGPVEAETAEEAAEYAWSVMQREGSSANVFEVVDPAGVIHHIDLDDPAENFVDLSKLEQERLRLRRTFAGIADVLRNVREAAGG